MGLIIAILILKKISIFVSFGLKRKTKVWSDLFKSNYANIIIIHKPDVGIKVKKCESSRKINYICDYMVYIFCFYLNIKNMIQIIIIKGWNTYSSIAERLSVVNS